MSAVRATAAIRRSDPGASFPSIHVPHPP